MLALSGQTHLKSSVLSSVKKVKYSISYAAEMWRYTVPGVWTGRMEVTLAKLHSGSRFNRGGRVV